jgi:hypothetical protein
MLSASYFRQILMKLKFSQQIFENYSNTKFHENPSSGSRDVLCGRIGRRTDRRKDMMKLIFAFRNFAKAPKMTDHSQLNLLSNVRGRVDKKLTYRIAQ